jgi:uncharacterized protein (DUF1501 family)
MTNWAELETADALRALSAPMANDTASMSRRRFLKTTAATGVAASVLPAWLGDVAANATPIGASDGVLVVVLMAGGNDGLNTIIPVDDGIYRDKRGALAVAEDRALRVAPGVGLHPNLVKLQARYRAGQVALLQGVGDLDPDMSHFTAMARWMRGHQSPAEVATGWLGRWLDGHAGADDLSAVVLGESEPLACIGARRRATALPASGNDAITGDHDEAWIKRSLDCLRDFGAGPTGVGAWADALGVATRGSIDLADVVKPVYRAELPAGKLVAQLELAARLVNANLGVRVLQVQYGDFDHHANQAPQHDERMAELDAGIDRFFATLSPTFAKRTTILTLSEFGRRPEANASGGTDHGEGSDLIAIGAGVKGGLYGEPMHLGHLSDHGCPIAHVDFRSVYSTVLETWLRADATEVLGGRFENLGFLRAPAL